MPRVCAAHSAARVEESAGFGRRLRHARACRWTAKLTRAKLGFAVVQEPVTAVQLSRGKAEAQLLFECALLMQDLGRAGRRPAAVLHAGIRVRDAAGIVHHRLVDHAAEAQSRRLRAGARPHAPWRTPASSEVLGIFAKLPSGYQRDLQLIKPPLFRGIDVALATAAIMAVAHRGVRFRAGEIKLDPAIHAAEEANALVVSEGIPFREAYRRIGEKYRK